MKAFNLGLDLEPKKYSYQNEDFKKLVDKFSAKKKSPYIFEVVDAGIESVDLVLIDKGKVVDFIIGDLEKIEQRLANAKDLKERKILEEAQRLLESEKLLFYCDLEEEALGFLKNLQLASLKPSVLRSDFNNSQEDLHQLIKEGLEAAGVILFFTASEKEVKAWGLKKGKSVLEAAEKIHSDLKRGFIRAEVVNYNCLDDFFNMAEAKSKGLVKTVDRDYIVESGDIVYIKFSV